MSRYAQGIGEKGSLRWIQYFVNEAPGLLDEAIARSSRGRIETPITWQSPRKEDEFAEYRDQAFLDRLNTELPTRQLEDFWPKAGPQWDALGLSPSGQRLLVEAKVSWTPHTLRESRRNHRCAWPSYPV